jgi:chain length determinant protein EpsF
MTPALFLSALRARYRIFFLILATTVVTTLAVSLITPKSYVANVALLVNGKDEQSLRNTGYATPDWDRTGYVQTQVDILTSPTVAHRVIDELHLADNPIARANFESASGVGPIEEWLAANLPKQLKTDTSQSSVIRLTYSSPDPNYSAQVANAFAKAYVNTTLDLRVGPDRQAADWFKEQLKGLRVNLEQAEQRLAAFRQEHGVAALEERSDVDNIQLADLAARLGRAGGTTNPADAFANPNVQALRADLRRAEAKLQEMSAELGDRHPQYLHQLAAVQSLRQTLANESRNVVTDAVQGRQRLKAEMEAQRDRVLKLAQERTQLSVLTRDVTMAQRTYDEVMQKSVASAVGSHALQTNVSVLSPAVPPAEAARPKILINVGVSIVVGILLGLAAVYLVEMSDRRVRALDDFDVDPQIPLLAVLNKWDPAANRLLGTPSIRPALPA